MLPGPSGAELGRRSAWLLQTAFLRGQARRPSIDTVYGERLENM